MFSVRMRCVYIAFSFLICTTVAIIPICAETNTVTTVAGGYVGNGKPATAAALAGPSSVVRDAKGNLFVSDTSNCRIRRINTKGVISNFAGTGICGFSGDGGPARTAMMRAPTGLVLDQQGNLLFADTDNYRVRRIDAAETITTVAGNGTFGVAGDGGPATQATLGSVLGISLGPSGKLYMADVSNNVIRMVDTTGTIHTVAGNGRYGFSGDGGLATSAQLALPYSVAVDASENLYIADLNNHRIRRVDFSGLVATSGVISTYAGNGSSGNTGSGGPATSASIGSPLGLLLSGGKLYISTSTNIWTADLTTQIVQVVAGSGVQGFNGDGNPALSTDFSGPWGMAIDSIGNLFVVDSSNSRVREIDSSQIVSTIAGGYLGDGGNAALASLNFGGWQPHIAFDPAGNLYIADVSNCRIRKVSSGIISTIAGTGMCGYSGDGGPATSATLKIPHSVAVDASGNIYIGDVGSMVIRKVDRAGTITTFLQSYNYNGFVAAAFAVGLAIGPDGSLYAADNTATVWRVTPDGSSQIVAGSGSPFARGYNGDGIPATQALLNGPTGVAFDRSGNLYISDRGNARIRKVDLNGIISTVAGTGRFGYSGDGGPATAAMLSTPMDIAADSKGNLYIADFSNFRVRVVDSSGTIQTFLGAGAVGYNGNNIAATSANVSPMGLAVDGKGKLYVTDLFSNRVRKVH